MINDDLRINYLIKQGTTGDIVIMGAPFGYARKKIIGKGGEDNGPCCLRRFFGKVGPIINSQYQISIEDIRVSDYGNINIQDEKSQDAPQKCIFQIKNQVLNILKNNKIPFVFGGSKQVNFGCSLGMDQYEEKSSQILICGRSYDSKQISKGLTSQNYTQMLRKESKSEIILFGLSKRYISQKNLQNQLQKVTYEDIRQQRVIQTKYINTQGATSMLKLLNKIKNNTIHISLMVDVIERFKGCRDILLLGLTVEQMMEIFLLLGSNQKIKLVSFGQFNPSCEDYESSLLLVNLLYYFFMGYKLRQK